MKLTRRDDENLSAEEIQQETAAEGGENAKNPEKKYSVFIYIAIMFVVAVAMILVSHFINERNNAIIDSLAEQHSEFSVEALQQIETLQAENVALMEQIDQMELERYSLMDELALAQQNEANAEESAEDAKEQAEEYENQYKAITYLLGLQVSVEKEDMNAAKARVAQLEDYKKYLSPEHKELYEDILEIIAIAEEGEQNNA